MDPHPEGMREHPELRQIALSHPLMSILEITEIIITNGEKNY
jgi:hypothetical protein